MAASARTESDCQSRLARCQRQVFSSMFVGWSLFVFCRGSFAASIPILIEKNGFSKEDIGFIASGYVFSYGVSKFVIAIVSDYVSSRRLLSLGLVLSGVCVLLFPLSSIVAVYAAINFVLGLLQGFGWAPCAQLLKAWYPPSSKGTWWSVLSCAGNVATALSPLCFTYVSMVSRWQLYFVLVGGTTFCTGCLLFFTITDSPMDVGLQPFEVQPEKNKNSNGKSTRWTDMFFYRDLWVTCSIYALLYVVSYVMQYWSVLYFIQEAGKSKIQAAACYGAYQMGGLCGNLVIGYISDFFITPSTLQTKAPRAPVLLTISLLLTFFFSLYSTTISAASSDLWISVLMFALGVLVYSDTAVIGLMSMEVVPGRLAGSAHGLACAMGQVGGLLASWPFSVVVETYSWSVAFTVVFACSVIMVGLCCYLMLLLWKGLQASHNPTHLD